jgi:hypothetical protein
MKTTLIIILILTGLLLTLLSYLYFNLPDYKPKVSIVSIYSERFDERIALKKKVWGVTGDHQVIVVSKSADDEFQADENREYVFEGFLPLFYRFERDTLHLYVRKASKVPDAMPTKITINQVVLNNTEMIELAEKYRELGLKKIE